MDQIYITGGGETLPELIDLHYGRIEGEMRSAAESLFTTANPFVMGGPFQPDKLLFFPDISEHLACTGVENINRVQTRKLWAELQQDNKAFLRETLRNNDPGMLEALLDVLEGYDAFTRTGYINTFAAGAVGGVVGRASFFATAAESVDALLKQYASAGGHQRGAIKPKVQAAYAKLQRAFANDIKAASARIRSSGRLGPLKSSRQGMQRAGELAQKGSRSSIVSKTPQAQRILKLAKYGRRLGNGMVVLDLGLRGYNVSQSDNKVRTAASEGTGFVASFWTGVATYKGCLGPAAVFSGPWSLAICLVPAGGVAIVADELGKVGGTAMYDVIAR